MTDLLSASALLIGKPCVAAVLRAWPLPVLMLDRICGKKLVRNEKAATAQQGPGWRTSRPMCWLVRLQRDGGGLVTARRSWLIAISRGNAQPKAIVRVGHARP